MTTSGRSVTVMWIWPEKLFKRSVPPGSSFIVRVTCSVVSWAPASAGIADRARAARARVILRMGTWTRPFGKTFALLSALSPLPSALSGRVQVQRAGVDRHAHDRVHTKRIQVVDFLFRRDSPGGGHPARRRGPDRADRVQVGAAHQPLGIDVGVEELVAIRLERADRVDGGQRQDGFPAVD